MIELAPHNKLGLALTSPLIAGSGAVGYADAWPVGVEPAMFGAIITAPLTWRPRRGRTAARHAELPGGFLLATGDHNPGCRRVLQDHDAAWRRLGVPVIVALASQRTGGLGATGGGSGRRIRGGGAGAAFAAHRPSQRRRGLDRRGPPRHDAAAAGQIADVARRRARRHLRQRRRRCAGDRQRADGGGSGCRTARWSRGRWLARSRFRLRCTGCARSPRWSLGLPLVAAGGICRPEDAELCFAAGAAAVQVRSLLWTDPAAAARMAEAVRRDE